MLVHCDGMEIDASRVLFFIDPLQAFISLPRLRSSYNSTILMRKFYNSIGYFSISLMSLHIILNHTDFNTHTVMNPSNCGLYD